MMWRNHQVNRIKIKDGWMPVDATQDSGNEIWQEMNLSSLTLDNCLLPFLKNKEQIVLTFIENI